jgi:hypothetical protein
MWPALAGTLNRTEQAVCIQRNSICLYVYDQLHRLKRSAGTDKNKKGFNRQSLNYRTVNTPSIVAQFFIKACKDSVRINQPKEKSVSNSVCGHRSTAGGYSVFTCLKIVSKFSFEGTKKNIVLHMMEEGLLGWHKKDL